MNIDAQIGRLYVIWASLHRICHIGNLDAQIGRLYNQPYMSYWKPGNLGRESITIRPVYVLYWKPGNLGVSTSSGNHDFMIELSVTKITYQNI